MPLPSYAHPGDAGADLTTAEDVELGPGERALVGPALAIALPDGYAAFVHPRSGLAAKYGVTLVNAPGTVDAGYRGEIKVTLLNTDRDRPVSFKRGDRIAQLVIQRVERALFHEVTSCPDRAGEKAASARPAGMAPATHPGRVLPGRARMRRSVRSVSSASFSRRRQDDRRNPDRRMSRSTTRMQRGRASRGRAAGRRRPVGRGRVVPRVGSAWTWAACQVPVGPDYEIQLSWPSSTAPG